MSLKDYQMRIHSMRQDFECVNLQQQPFHFSVTGMSLQSNILPGMCVDLIGQRTARQCFIAVWQK